MKRMSLILTQWHTSKLPVFVQGAVCGGGAEAMQAKVLNKTTIANEFLPASYNCLSKVYRPHYPETRPDT